MKYILGLFFYFYTSLLNANEWQSHKNIYYTHAEDGSINHFGFNVISGGKCDLEVMLFVINTSHKELNSYQDEPILLNFHVDNKIKFQIKTGFYFEWKEHVGIGMVYFDKFLFNKETIDLFTKSKTVTISIEEKQKLSQYFDIKTHTFLLHGMEKQRIKFAQNPCDLAKVRTQIEAEDAKKNVDK